MTLVAVVQGMLERQNKDLSELLWRRGEGERLLLAAETTFAQVWGGDVCVCACVCARTYECVTFAQESAAAAALSAGAEGPEMLKGETLFLLRV